MYALSANTEIGTVRETFFNNQLSAYNEVLLPHQGDFLVDRKYLFEVGGKNKTFEQIKDIENSYRIKSRLKKRNKSKSPY